MDPHAEYGLDMSEDAVWECAAYRGALLAHGIQVVRQTQAAMQVAQVTPTQPIALAAQPPLPPPFDTLRLLISGALASITVAPPTLRKEEDDAA